MTITYEVGDSLYVNLTNKCTNNCDFCIRKLGAGAYGSDPLWLEREPTEEEAYEDIIGRDLAQYKELVFCGYGEPTERLDTLVNIAKRVKQKSSISIRINTNGQANLIYGCDITPMLEGCIDTVSISLNEATAEKYNAVCHPIFPNAYDALIEFASLAKQYVSNVVMSVVSTTLSDEDIAVCAETARNAGVKFRVRQIVK